MVRVWPCTKISWAQCELITRTRSDAKECQQVGHTSNSRRHSLLSVHPYPLWREWICAVYGNSLWVESLNGSGASFSRVFPRNLMYRVRWCNMIMRYLSEKIHTAWLKTEYSCYRLFARRFPLLFATNTAAPRNNDISNFGARRTTFV